jgi:hypothetical protein
MKSIIRNKFFAIALPLIAFFGLVLSSCSIDDSVNNSPNAINEAKVKSIDGIKGLLVGLQVATADFYAGDRSRMNSFFTWQMCAPSGMGRPQPVAWNSYNMVEDGPTDDAWKIAYRAIKIADDIISYTPTVNFNDEKINSTIIGIAKTYKALLLGELAGMYGSIPVEINGLNPAAFVDMKTAMAKVQTLLDEAKTNFASTAAVAQDMNFKGDGTKWVPVVNSLKARYYLMIKDYTNALTSAKAGMTAGALNGIYTSNANEYSPWGHWTLTEAGEPLRGEKTLVDLLKSEAGDKRLAEYFTPKGTTYWGFAAHKQPGADTNEAKNASIVSLKKYGKYEDDFPLISYYETVLIMAECKARANDLAGAATDVNIIRKAAGLTDFAATDGVKTVAEILKQKYIQLFLEGQAYYDMRRVGVLPETKVPRRWIYPQSELNANPNVPANDPLLVKDAMP